LTLFRNLYMERYLDFWSLAKIGQKPWNWAILTLFRNLYMERYLDFWSLAKTSIFGLFFLKIWFYGWFFREFFWKIEKRAPKPASRKVPKSRPIFFPI
jgi:hypothetical protein